MVRASDALAGEVDRSTEPDAASIEAGLLLPVKSNGADLRQHPFGSALAIGRPRFEPDHTLVFEQGNRKFGAADVHRQSIHGFKPRVTLVLLVSLCKSKHKYYPLGGPRKWQIE